MNYIFPYCNILCCLYCITLYWDCVLNGIVLYCNVLYCIVLYVIVTHCIVLYCIIEYHIAFYCIVLHNFELYCIILACFLASYIVLYCICSLTIILNVLLQYGTGLRSALIQFNIMFALENYFVSYYNCHKQLRDRNCKFLRWRKEKIYIAFEGRQPKDS